MIVVVASRVRSRIQQQLGPREQLEMDRFDGTLAGIVAGDSGRVGVILA